jgi:hypothetical protein
MNGYQLRIHVGADISKMLKPSKGHVQGGPNVPLIWLIHCIRRETFLEEIDAITIPPLLPGRPPIKMSQSSYADDHTKLARANTHSVRAATEDVLTGMLLSGDQPSREKNVVAVIQADNPLETLLELQHGINDTYTGLHIPVSVELEVTIRGLRIGAGAACNHTS